MTVQTYLVKNYKEPDLTPFMSHPEIKTVEIPFLKENESDLPRIKFSSYNVTTKKNVDFFFYDYIGHSKGSSLIGNKVT